MRGANRKDAMNEFKKTEEPEYSQVSFTQETWLILVEGTRCTHRW